MKMNLCYFKLKLNKQISKKEIIEIIYQYKNYIDIIKIFINFIPIIIDMKKSKMYESVINLMQRLRKF